MEFFNELGRSVSEDWKKLAYDPLGLPELATAALRAFNPSEEVTVEDIARWSVEAESLPAQIEHGSKFGQPPLTLYADERLYITALFWLDSTTAVHQHSFAGAFHVLHGSSIHSQFTFEQHERVNDSLRLGDLRLGHVERFTAGATQPIHGGDVYIHSLFHLDRPSVTIVVRSYKSRELEPQFRYLPPHIALDDLQEAESLVFRGDMLYMLASIKHPSYEDLLAGWLAEADAESTVRVLWTLARRGALQGERRERAVQAVAARHARLAEYLGPTLASEERSIRLFAMREAMREAEHRLMLALLLSAPPREDALRIINEAYPDVKTSDLLMSFLRKLGELGKPPVSPVEVMQLFGAAPAAADVV